MKALLSVERQAATLRLPTLRGALFTSLHGPRPGAEVDSWAGFFAEFGLAAPLDLFFEASLDGFVDELTAASVQRSEECGQAPQPTSF